MLPMTFRDPIASYFLIALGVSPDLLLGPTRNEAENIFSH